MPAMAMSATMISSTMSIVMIPMPIAMPVITVPVPVITTVSEINRRCDDHGRGAITIIGRRGIIGSRRTNWCWLTYDYPRQGRQRERQPNSDVESHSGLRSRNGSEENCTDQKQFFHILIRRGRTSSSSRQKIFFEAFDLNKSPGAASAGESITEM